MDSDTSTGQKLYNARVLCDGQKSFANYFDFAYERGRVSTPDPRHYNSSLNSEVDGSSNETEFEKFIQAVRLLNDVITLINDSKHMTRTYIAFQETLECNEFIRLCRWAGKAENCSNLFKSIITEYGRCCIFNGLPDHLIQKLVIIIR